MVTTSRTLGPLHFEDLEPKRFEDLTRQLLYDFRPWREIEATGRSGSDESFDVRAWERGTTGEGPEVIDEAGDTDQAPLPTSPDRLWLIQCKREKTIPPKKLLGYLEAIPEEHRSEIYGIIFVAACDFSFKARNGFREKVRELGFSEGYLWGKGEVEDMLYQPKNDHLLFAYFGISLQTRRRSLASAVRGKMAAKRKAKRLLQSYQHVLLRDASDTRYPYRDEGKPEDAWTHGRWIVFQYDGFVHNGLKLLGRSYSAFIADDRVAWDYLPASESATPPQVDPWSSKRHNYIPPAARAAHSLWRQVPETNQARYEVFAILPFEDLVDIDEDGDDIFSGPIIYFSPRFSDGRLGLSAIHQLSTFGDRRQTYYPDAEKRIAHFPTDLPTSDADEQEIGDAQFAADTEDSDDS